jgi:hypothetical protein
MNSIALSDVPCPKTAATVARCGRLARAATLASGVGVLLAAVLVGGCRQASDGTKSEDVALTTDEACELLIHRGIEDAIGAWAVRYQTMVWCNRDGGHQIAVTITPANGQEGRRTDPEMTRKMAESVIAGILERKGWKSRYSRVTVQFTP